MKQIEKWAGLILIVVASCNAGLHPKKTAGLPTADSRILGGTNTTIEKYPFAVQIFNKTYYHYWIRCGGSLVTTSLVLSGAHCFFDGNGQQGHPDDYYIRASTSILNSGGSLHSITAIKIHELYNITTRDNDVAVVLMTTPVDLATSVARPVYFAYQGSVVPDNTSVAVVGWGKGSNEKKVDYGTYLNELTVRIINLKKCQARFKTNSRKVTSNMICAGILDVGGKAPCEGDFGGALLYKNRVVGLVSWSSSTICGDPKYPTVYTKVASYTKWISNTIKEFGVYTNRGSTGSPSSNVGAIKLLSPILYLILSNSNQTL